MEINTMAFKNCSVVRATGRVDADASPQLEEAFKAIMGAGRFQIVFDMSGVAYISSSGLQVLVDTNKVCKHLGRGRLTLACVPPLVQESLKLAGFYTFFRVYETALEAVGNA